MNAHPQTAARPRLAPSAGLAERVLRTLNGLNHRRAVMVFLAIVMAHWVEHVFQAIQIFVLGWARPDANGALGLLWPALIRSEWLHYVYALLMLIGLVLLRRGFSGPARRWWTAALVIQAWHHVEHLLLLVQAQAHHPFFGKPVPTSIIQLIAPRVELHLFYNALVTTPIAVAVYLQFRSRRAAPAGSPAVGRSGAPAPDVAQGAGR